MRIVFHTGIIALPAIHNSSCHLSFQDSGIQIFQYQKNKIHSSYYTCNTDNNQIDFFLDLRILQKLYIVSII